MNNRKDVYFGRFIALALILIMFVIPITSIVAFADEQGTYVETDGSDFAFSGGEITDYNGNATDIVIPKMINGETVVKIGANSLQMKALTSVVIPDTVTEIDDFAMSYVEGLKTVRFLGQTPVIGNAVFSDENGTIEGITFYCHVDYKDNYMSAIYDSAGEYPAIETFGASTGNPGGGTPPVSPQQDPYEDFEFIAVGSEGYSVAKYKGSGGEVVIPEQYQNKPIVAIGDNAFDPSGTGFSKITSVKMPNTITSIGNWAFYNCIKMENINLSNNLNTIGEHAFQRCDALVEITVPKQVSEIKDMAFAFCEKLRNIYVESGNSRYRDIDGVLYSANGKVLINYPAGRASEEYNIPEGTEIIFKDAFKLYYSNNTSKLRKVNFPDSLKEIGDRAFMQTRLEDIVIIPGIKMGEYVFDQCKNVKNVEVKEGVTKIEKGMLYALEGCETVKLPSSLKEIGYRAFDRLAVTHIELPEGLEIIGEEAFESSKLTAIEIPASVKQIGPRAFYSSKNLKEVSFNNNSRIETIGEYAFNHCKGLEIVNLPDSITRLPDGVFSHCYSLKTIKLPDGMMELGDVVFSGSALEHLVLPSGIKNIGHSVFRGCANLRSIKMPDKLENLGMSTFEDCHVLVKAEFPESIKLQYLPEDTFFNCRAIKYIYLPGSIKETRACAFSNCIMNPVIEYGNKGLKRSLFDCFPINLDGYGGYYEIVDSENMTVRITSDVPAEREENFDKLQTLNTGSENGRAPAGSSSLCGCAGAAGAVFSPNCKPVFRYKPAASGEIVIPHDENQVEKPNTANAGAATPATSKNQQPQISPSAPSIQYQAAQNQQVAGTSSALPQRERGANSDSRTSGNVNDLEAIDTQEESNLINAFEGSGEAESEDTAVVPRGKEELKAANKYSFIMAIVTMAAVFGVSLLLISRKSIFNHFLKR